VSDQLGKSKSESRNSKRQTRNSKLEIRTSKARPLDSRLRGNDQGIEIRRWRGIRNSKMKTRRQAEWWATDGGGSVALLPEGTEGGFGFPADDGQQDARRACGLVCQKFTVHSLQFTVKIHDAANCW